MRVLEGCAEQSFEIVAGHVSVRDPEDLKSGALKNGTAGRVVAPLRLCVVRVTIQFDYDPSLQATKVHDEAVKYVLPAKLETKHTAIAQQRPRESLCGRRARALLSRQREFLSARDSS